MSLSCYLKGKTFPKKKFTPYFPNKWLIFYLQTIAMKSITIKDVAEKLGVSISSVSRAFNSSNKIKKETRDRILETAEKMGYYPNPIAQKLTQKKTYNIGVIVPEFLNEYYSDVIRGIQDVLTPIGYQTLIMQSENNVERELKNVKTLIQNRMDGLVICPSAISKNSEYYLAKIKEGYPIVFLNRIEEAFPAKKVLFNNIKWSFFATEHLIYQGYKKIYHLSGNKDLGITKDRTKGFIQAVKKHGFSQDDYKVIETGIVPEDAMRQVQQLIDDNDMPEAFFCVNDIVAISVISVLKQNGIEVPLDVGIVGFTEMKISHLISPKLSSVKQPSYEMGKSSANLLIKLIRNEFIPDETIVLNGLLNIRESSAKRKVPE